ncbi:putative ankyrin repeat protein RBE_0997 [Argopecten irradians]|uniref:putative ankyrin repeat protein RBE_0997 n=1 Tax=Argopecten irradians TaxID=31199 RepID=UPI003710A9C1
MADLENRLYDALETRNRREVIYLIEEGANLKTVMGGAMFVGNVDIVKFLLELGANPNWVLNSAIWWNTVDFVKVSLEHGADPNERNALERAVRRENIGHS